jgi:hypothetical protein
LTALVFAAPYVPPPPPVPAWAGYVMTWTGPDGFTWALDGSQGVLLLQDGLVGLHLPGYDRYTSTAPATAGSRHRGSRAQERSVEWNLLVYADDSSEEWRALDRAFWSSFDVDDPGVWTVTDPAGRSLSLDCRLVPQNDPYDRDPSLFGWALYHVQLVANQPFWRGEQVSQSWQNTTAVPFFGVDGQLHISNGSSATSAIMSNPGDVDAWPVWTITGPMTSLSITVNGGMITIPTLTSTETLVVDTDPGVATAIKNGVDVSGTVDPWDPRPIPRGDDGPLTINANGTGTIAVSITPRYRRGI